MKFVNLLGVLVILTGTAVIPYSNHLLKRQSLLNSKRNKLNRFNEMVELNRVASSNKIVLTGDSITHWYPVHELVTDKIVYNRGNAGYFTHELLRSFDEVVLTIEPKKLFILIGTNDMSIKNVSPKEACDNTESIIKKIKYQLPETEVYLISVYPVNVSKHDKVLKKIHKMNKYYPKKIVELNELYKSLVSKYDINYIDLYEGLCDKDGQLNIDYTIDGLHLSTEGYSYVTERLNEYM